VKCDACKEVLSADKVASKYTYKQEHTLLAANHWIL